jgi:hypothetical protein
VKNKSILVFLIIEFSFVPDSYAASSEEVNIAGAESRPVVINLAEARAIEDNEQKPAENFLKIPENSLELEENQNAAYVPFGWARCGDILPMPAKE